MSNIARPKKVKSQSRNRRISLGVTYTILVILSIIWLIPLVWIVLSAFRCEYQADGTFIGKVTSNFFPKQYGFKNFADLFNATYYGVPNAFPKWVLNTFIIAVIDCVISTFLVLSVAYCMSKLKFKLRKAFMNISMIIGLFPGFMSMIAIYFLLKSIGLTGNADHPEYSMIGLVLAYSAGAGLGFQIAKGFFDVIPNALVESAKLDGCTNFKIFRRIILPLAKPIIIYQALMSFTGPWMDFIFAKVIIGASNARYWTVSVGLYQMLFGSQYSDPNFFTQFAAGCVIVAIPIVTLFMFLQKYYVEGVTAGAVKG
ncbi:MAG: sugar ABC transporter permease [Clostridia bacterium]|nr:sugar ABC transporter permease [Clostridia bacterium]